VSVSLGDTLIAVDGGFDAELVREAVPSGRSRTVALGDGIGDVLRVLEGSPHALLIVGYSVSSDGALALVREARRRHDDCAIVVVHAGSPNGFMEQAFKVGADDLLTLPQPREALTFALEKAVARRRRSTPARLAPMICIVGPKGGTGKTPTACNLAVALARAGARPALVDIDLQFGDVGLSLGLAPEHTIYDLAVSGSAADPGAVGRFLTRHSSGVDALLAPVRPDQAGGIKIDFLREVYSALRAEHDFLIVDTPPAFTPEVISSIDVSTHLCVVGMLDALSLKDTKIGLETLALMGRDLAGITLVLNRADTSVGISMDDVGRILGRQPDVLVPSDRAIPRAITQGQPIVLADDRSGPAQAFIALADIYLRETAWSAPGAGEEDQSARPARRSLLRKGR
jgi:pilus assembly protein CpaE